MKKTTTTTKQLERRRWNESKTRQFTACGVRCVDLGLEFSVQIILITLLSLIFYKIESIHAIHISCATQMIRRFAHSRWTHPFQNVHECFISCLKANRKKNDKCTSTRNSPEKNTLTKISGAFLWFDVKSSIQFYSLWKAMLNIFETIKTKEIQTNRTDDFSSTKSKQVKPQSANFLKSRLAEMCCVVCQIQFSIISVFVFFCARRAWKCDSHWIRCLFWKCIWGLALNSMKNT